MTIAYGNPLHSNWSGYMEQVDGEASSLVWTTGRRFWNNSLNELVDMSIETAKLGVPTDEERSLIYELASSTEQTEEHIRRLGIPRDRRL